METQMKIGSETAPGVLRIRTLMVNLYMVSRLLHAGRAGGCGLGRARGRLGA